MTDIDDAVHRPAACSSRSRSCWGSSSSCSRWRGSSPATRACRPRRAGHASGAARFQPPQRPRPADTRPVRHLSPAARDAATWGPRSSTRSPVTELIVERLPMTIELTFCALIFATSRGHPARASSRHTAATRKTDVGTMVFANFGRLDARLRAGAAAGVPLRDRPEGHAVRAAAIGPSQLRASTVRRCRRSGASRT